MDLSALVNDTLTKARTILKALDDVEGKKGNAPVPEEPERKDPRVEDASPTEEDKEKLKKDAKPDEGEGAGDGKDDGAGKDEGEGEGEGAGDDDGDEYEDVDPRELKKALGLFGAEVDPKIPTAAAFEKLTALLTEFMAEVRGRMAFLDALKEKTDEIEASQGEMSRNLKKALEDAASAATAAQGASDALKSIHLTAPAAEPRAITKAHGEGAEKPLTTADVNKLAMSKQFSAHEIARINRVVNNQTN